MCQYSSRVFRKQTCIRFALDKLNATSEYKHSIRYTKLQMKKTIGTLKYIVIIRKMLAEDHAFTHDFS